MEFRHAAKALCVLGYGGALGELIPEVQPEVRVKGLLAPERKHASPGLNIEEGNLRSLFYEGLFFDGIRLFSAGQVAWIRAFSCACLY